MKRWIFLLLLGIIMLIASSVDAATLNILQTNTSKLNLTGAKIPKSNVDQTMRYISLIDSKLGNKFKDVTVLVSTHKFANPRRLAQAVKAINNKYYIILANEKSDFATVARSLYHELSHIKQWKDNIDLEEYSDIVYGYKYTRYFFMDDWKYRLQEEFAEDGMRYMINKHFPYLNKYVSKWTAREYDEFTFSVYMTLRN